MVHEVKKVDEVERIDTMVLFVDQDKVVFVRLIPHIKFVLYFLKLYIYIYIILYLLFKWGKRDLNPRHLCWTD